MRDGGYELSGGSQCIFETSLHTAPCYFDFDPQPQIFQALMMWSTHLFIGNWLQMVETLQTVMR